MNHKISDINAYLFESLDALSNDELTEEELKSEINRSKQIANVSKTIIANGKLMLEATKHADEYYRNRQQLPEMLVNTSNEEN